MVDGYQKEALTTPLAIPILYGIDAVHGIGLMRRSHHLPAQYRFGRHARSGLGPRDRPGDRRRNARRRADDGFRAGDRRAAGRALGPNLRRLLRRHRAGFGIGQRVHSGLQSIPAETTSAPGQTIGVLATAKHYLGDGDTVWGSSRQNIANVPYMLDQGNMQADEQTVRTLFLPPYQAAVKAGAMSVMVSYSSWNGTKMHADHYLITTVLKEELGFKGFVISDYGGIAQIDPGDYYTSVVTAVNAGIDMGMIDSGYSGVHRRA